MERVLVSEVGEFVGKRIRLQGWVYRLRRLSKVAFVLLRDRTGVLQVVFTPENFDGLELSVESVVEIVGTVVCEPKAQTGYEVQGEEITVISLAKELPFQVNSPSLSASLDTILNHRVVSLRHDKLQPIFRVQSALATGFQQFLSRNGFVQIFTPKIVASGTEGGTELFELQYFEQKAFLAQSPQFYKQMMVGAGYERVFEIGHVFRAEHHSTSRHINEYVSLDLEMGFIKDEGDIMTLENELLRFMLGEVQEKCGEDLERLGASVPQVATIPRITLAEALNVLQKEYGKENGNDLDPEGERLVCEFIKKETGSEFVFVTAYPKEKRPMYAMPCANGLTRSFDLLFRGLEITTGGQRIHCYDELVASIAGRGLNPKSFAHYIEVFRLGMPPHGGLGMGLERLTAQLLGLANIREATLFPRDRYRINP